MSASTTPRGAVARDTQLGAQPAAPARLGALTLAAARAVQQHYADRLAGLRSFDASSHADLPKRDGPDRLETR